MTPLLLSRRELMAMLAAAGWPDSYNRPLILAPTDPAQWPEFRQALARFREDSRARLRYDDRLYRRPDLAWTASSFACSFLMLYDLMFHDPVAGRYSVDRWLDEGEREFGGYDSVVLWQAYPRIGLDGRNQFDFYRDMPGGLAGLRGAVDAFHARNVKVYIDYNPWDRGTRREPQDDLPALAEMIRALDADGIFLDTMNKGAGEFRALLDQVRPGVALEGEGALPLENLHDHHLSWAQYFEDSWAPGILRNKWIERRHMQHLIRRWSRNHTEELHSAWMNGCGVLVWENVFGTLVAWSQRDRSILREMLPIQRRFAKRFSGEGWTPLVATAQQDVFASLWEGDGLRLWTLVNRGDQPRRGKLLEVRLLPGERCYDLIHGRESAGFESEMPPRGIAAFLAGRPSGDFTAFLAKQAERAAKANYDPSPLHLRTVWKQPARAAVARTRPPQDMAAIYPAPFHLVVEMRVRECGFYGSDTEIDLRGSYQPHTVTFERTVELMPFAIDLTPVTNEQFAEFMAGGGYRPRHRENFLKHWTNGQPPRGREDHPVVYVDLDDARAYARWKGKRLPTEEEWQYAAQGPQALRYPWGKKMRAGAANGGETGGTTPVKMFPEGRSPFGCWDMCGNVWEWTESEYSDGRTRFSMLKGGSFFEAKGSNWYMGGGPKPANFSEKMLLMWPGLDRCATIGFRCAADLG